MSAQLKAFPLYQGPLDGLIVAYERPQGTPRCDIRFGGYTGTEFYSFDPALERFVWAGGAEPSAMSVKISPQSPLVTH